MRTVVYTAEIDDRFGSGKVSSRIGLSSPARLYNTQTALFADIADEHKRQPIHCVLVDESQFLTREQVREMSGGGGPARYSRIVLWIADGFSRRTIYGQSIFARVVR